MQIYGLLSMKFGTLAENNIYDKAVNDSFTATWRLHKSTKQQAKFNFKCSEKQEKHHLAMGLCLTHWGAYSAVRTQPPQLNFTGQAVAGKKENERHWSMCPLPVNLKLWMHQC